MTELQTEQQAEAKYDAAIIGLTMDREKLYERINRRVDMMIQAGLLQEVQQLFARRTDKLPIHSGNRLQGII